MSDPVAAAYDRWAPSYDGDANTTRDLDGRALRAAALPLHGAAVLEIGCGTGRNTAYLAEHARFVLALDFSAEMLARARARCPAPHVRFVAQDIRAPWPAERASIDLVVCDLVLEHVEDLRPIFAAARRVLRPGGVLFVSELHPYAQLLGKQANFVDPATRVATTIAVHRHSVTEFVQGGIDADLVLENLTEWFVDDAARAHGEPRLLTLRFRAPAS